MKIYIVMSAFLAGVFLMPIKAMAASEANIDKMTTYAVILGRAVACGVDIAPEMQQVGAWMDKTFPPGSSDQRTYLPIFMKGVKHHAEQQKSGNSPDTCAEVRGTYRKMQWP